MFDVLVVVAVKVILLGNEAREICRRFGTNSMHLGILSALGVPNSLFTDCALLFYNFSGTLSIRLTEMAFCRAGKKYYRAISPLPRRGRERL